MRWQWNGSADYSTGGLHRLNNLLGRLVDEVVIVRLEFDSDFLRHLTSLLAVALGFSDHFFLNTVWSLCVVAE